MCCRHFQMAAGTDGWHQTVAITRTTQSLICTLPLVSQGKLVTHRVRSPGKISMQHIMAWRSGPDGWNNSWPTRSRVMFI